MQAKTTLHILTETQHWKYWQFLDTWHMADEKPMEGVLVTDGIMDFAPDSCQVHLIVIQTSQQEPKIQNPRSVHTYQGWDTEGTTDHQGSLSKIDCSVATTASEFPD